LIILVFNLLLYLFFTEDVPIWVETFEKV